MLILEDVHGNKVMVSPRYFVAAYKNGADTYVVTTACEFKVKETVDEIIDVIQKSVMRLTINP
jgi:hypothetical protein